MNNTKLWLKYGLVALAGGVIVFFGLRDFPDSPYLMGLGFGLLGSVAVQAIRTLYWAMPSHREERQRRLKEEKINLADERKIMLRHLSGYRMNQIMFLVNCLLCTFFGLMKAPVYVIATMVLVLVFQYLCGVVLFHRYSKTM